LSGDVNGHIQSDVKLLPRQSGWSCPLSDYSTLF